jgi:hypothetical protein
MANSHKRETAEAGSIPCDKPVRGSKALLNVCVRRHPDHRRSYLAPLYGQMGSGFEPGTLGGQIFWGGSAATAVVCTIDPDLPVIV